MVKPLDCNLLEWVLTISDGQLLDVESQNCAVIDVEQVNSALHSLGQLCSPRLSLADEDASFCRFGGTQALRIEAFTHSMDAAVF